MPYAPARPCHVPTCARLAAPGAVGCPDHRKPSYRTHSRTRQQRGYGPAYQRARAATIKAQPFCSICGHMGSKANPLTADHFVSIKQGGGIAGNLVTLCRRCNSRKGGR